MQEAFLVGGQRACQTGVSTPIVLAAISSSRIEITARPCDESSRLRVMTSTASKKTNTQNHVVSVGMPTMPREPFISGKTLSELFASTKTTIVRPRVAMPK